MLPYKDKSLPYYLQKRKINEQRQAEAEQFVYDWRRCNVTSLCFNKRVYTDYTREDAKRNYILNIAFKQRCRERLRDIFDSEYALYLKVLEDAKLTESYVLEDKAQLIASKKRYNYCAKEEFNKYQYDKLFEYNCDEVRHLKQKVNDRAAALTLDYYCKRKYEEAAKCAAEYAKIDYLRIADYKRYYDEMREQAMRKRIEIKQHQYEMEASLNQRQILEAQNEAYRLIQLYKEMELNERYQTIKQLERDVERRYKLENRLFLETQIEVQRARDAYRKANALKEEQANIEQINQEIRMHAIEEMKAKELLRDEQACYVMLLEYRYRVKAAEIAALEKHYHEAILRGKQAEDSRKREERERWHRIQTSCQEYNLNKIKQQTEAEQIYQQLYRESEKQRWLEDYRALEEEQLIYIYKKVDAQHEWVEFLKMQKQESMEREQAALRRDAEHFKLQRANIYQEKQKTGALIYKYENYVKEITEALWSEPVAYRKRFLKRPG